MTNTRASLIDDIDLSEFKPKSSTDDKIPSADEVRIVSEEANFHSREPSPKKKSQLIRAKKGSYYKRGGNKQQFNIKAEQDTIDSFYKIASENGWSLGETLQEAILALEMRLKSGNQR